MNGNVYVAALVLAVAAYITYAHYSEDYQRLLLKSLKVAKKVRVTPCYLPSPRKYVRFGKFQGFTSGFIR